MRNTLAFLGAAMLTLLGVGWYLGWYDIKREPSTPGHSRLQIDINQEKIGKDVKEGTDKIKDAIDKHTPDSTEPADKKPADSKPPHNKSSAGAKDQTKEALRELIVDGWFTQEKK